MDSLESDLKNYKSLFEEIAQNDNNIYLNKSFQDALQYIDTDTKCCCCKVHRTRHRSFISGGAVTNTKSFNVPTMYNSIWIGEMKNATDYIEYLNETRRVSFSSLNRDNRSNYYNSMVNDSGYSQGSYENKGHDDDNGKNHLQVPKSELPPEHMRRTPEFEKISKKIDEIHTLDSSVSSLIYKSIEVHADILSLDATVSRLLAETRKLLEELEDVKCLDDIIDVLNSERIFYPIIHREWMFPLTNCNKIPIDEGVVVG